MIQKLSSLQQLSKYLCSWLALVLFGISSWLLVGPPLRLASPSSIKVWEFIIILLLSLQLLVSPSIQQLIRSHFSANMSQPWISRLIEGGLFGLFIILIAILIAPVGDHILIIFNGPFLIAFVVATLTMMGLYLSGRFS